MMVMREELCPLPTGLKGDTERLLDALLLPETLTVDDVGDAGTDLFFDLARMESRYRDAYDWMSEARDANRLSDDFELVVAPESSLPPPSSSFQRQLDDPSEISALRLTTTSTL